MQTQLLTSQIFATLTIARLDQLWVGQIAVARLTVDQRSAGCQQKLLYTTTSA